MFKNLKIVYYQLINESGRLDSLNRANVAKLVQMLENIKRRKGDVPFIREGVHEYHYYTKNGIPYYRREDRYSRKDEPMPIPVFIFNDQVYVGYNRYLEAAIKKALH